MRSDIHTALIQLRRDLHRYPELSGSEKETSGRLLAFLESCAPDEIVTGLGGHGLAVIFKGRDPGPDLLFRAETDAVAVHETALFQHVSLRPGVSHKCGHDGHMAILCGVAASLKGRTILKGRLILLFQPAEETGAGAAGVTADEKFAALVPDYSFAIHNWPGFPEGHIVVREGAMFAASTGMAVELTGKSSHAMAPEEGISPAEALKKIHTLLSTLHHSDRSSPTFTLITTVGIHLGGEDYGVSPGKGSLYLTIRAYEQKELDHLIRELMTRIKSIAEEESLSVVFRFMDTFPAVHNGSECTGIIRKAAETAGIPVISPDRGMGSSEDVGHIFNASRRGGAICLLGSGENSPPLHSGEYDFKETLIPAGTDLLLQIAEDLLGLTVP